jgi:hypothetical protein
MQILMFFLHIFVFELNWSKCDKICHVVLNISIWCKTLVQIFLQIEDSTFMKLAQMCLKQFWIRCSIAI